MWARVSREGAYVAESTMWLDPRRFNLHQIHAASENGCALLDIMIPPYNKYVDASWFVARKLLSFVLLADNSGCVCVH